MSFKIVKRLRIASQTFFLLLFIGLFYFGTTIGLFEAESWFFFTDPLHFLVSITSTGMVISIFSISVLLLILTIILGRVFCGWICPMGSLHQFFSSFCEYPGESTMLNMKRPGSIRFILLGTVVFLPLAGLNLAGWIDPMSLFTRTLASWHRPVVILIFISIILSNMVKHRFFCRILCPLGALYHLAAIFKLTRWVTNDNCTNCKNCSVKCHGCDPTNPADNQAECMLCMNCSSACKKDALTFSWRRIKPRMSEEYIPSRRLAISSLLSASALIVLPKITLAGDAKGKSSLVRPPGSLPEADFLDRCSRCGICVKSCPTGLIQHADLFSGLENFWTPNCEPEMGGCEWECTACLNHCPSGAIRKMSLNEKQKFKIGTAIINKNTCYTYADGINCTACVDACPLPEKAIVLKEAKVINYLGEMVTNKQVHLLPESCTGCGLCVKACPRKDSSALRISPEDEIRSKEIIF